MNHRQLITRLAQKAGLTEDHALPISGTIVSQMLQALTQGETVALGNVGALRVVQVKEKILFNPASGEKTLLPPRLVPVFLPKSRPQSTTLAHAIAQECSVSEDIAAAWLTQFAACIEEGLMEDEQVEIDGLGMFAQHELATSRQRITFTPTEDAKSLINKPFEHFVSVPLKPGVELPDTEMVLTDANGEYEETLQVEDFEETEQPLEEEDVTENQEPSDITEETLEEVSAPAQEEPEPAPAETAPSSEAETEASPAENEASGAETEPAQEETPAREKAEATPVEEVPAPVEDVPTEKITTSPSEDKPKNGKKMLYPWLLGIAAVCLIGIVCAVLPSKKTTEEAQPTEQVQPTASETAADNAARQQERERALFQRANEQVATLPYEITGVYDTIHISAPTTSVALAQRYGGIGSEIYIRVLNEGKRQFGQGDEVLIPVIELREK